MSLDDAVKLRSPGDVAVLIPHLVGFHPTESLVAVSLRPPRKRVGLTIRVDLADGPALARQVVATLLRDEPSSCLLVVYADAPSAPGLPRAELVRQVEEGLDECGVEVEEALLVRSGRWWSYRCAQRCCPAEGTLVDPGNPRLHQVAASAAYVGRAVLASRAELVASVRPVFPLGAAVAEREQEQADAELALRLLSDPESAYEQEIGRWRAALAAWREQPGRFDHGVAAGLLVALRLVAVRDEVASWGRDADDALLGLLLQVARCATPPDDAPVCTVLAWVAYARGDGALALVAVERALATEPDYSAATLLLSAIDAVLPPEQLRQVLRGTSGVLKARRRIRRRTAA